MYSSKLIRLFRALEEDEVKKLYKFLQSPYFNSNQKVIQFFQILRKSYPHFEEAQLEKEKLFSKLFPGEPFKAGKFLKLMSKLSKLVEDFMLIQYVKRDVQTNMELHLSMYQERDLYDLCIKQSEELIDQLNQDPFRDRLYYLKLMQLYQDLYFYTNSEQPHETKSLTEAMDNLDRFYFLAKLQLSAEMQTRQHIWAEEYEIKLEEEVEHQLNALKPSSESLHHLYLNVLQLHRNQADKGLFLESKQLYVYVLQTIRRQEKQIIFQHLANYCIRFINQGEKAFKKDLFELYQLGLEHNILVEKGKISSIAFSNIVAISASLHQVDWALSFIKKYSKNLKKRIADEVETLSLALCYFKLKNYDQVFQLLNQIYCSDIRNLLKSKCLLLRTCFEMFELDRSYFELLSNKAHAFEKFIRRNRSLSEEKEVAYLNFVKYYQKIAKAKMDRKDLSGLAQNLNSQSQISYRDWLLDKVKT